MKLRERYQLTFSFLLMVVALCLAAVLRFDFVTASIGIVLSSVLMVSIRNDKMLLSKRGNIIIK